MTSDTYSAPLPLEPPPEVRGEAAEIWHMVATEARASGRLCAADALAVEVFCGCCAVSRKHRRQGARWMLEALVREQGAALLLSPELVRRAIGEEIAPWRSCES